MPWLLALPILVAGCSSQADDPRPLEPPTAETAAPAMPEGPPDAGSFVDLCESGQVIEAGGTVLVVPLPCTRFFIDKGRPPDEVSRTPVEENPTDRVMQRVAPISAP